METKPNGISIHIGLNSVDPKHYQGWSGVLVACENDAEVYKSIAIKAGFKPQSILTVDATSENVINAISKAGKDLKKGDTLLLSYSGHGGSVPDTNGDEDDKFDETWCLYDREFIDDELYTLFSKFDEGVQILIFSDSCHSGTIAKAATTNIQIVDNKTGYIKSRLMPMRSMIDTYSANKELYDELQENNKAKSTDIKSYVISFGACQDNEEAMEVWDNGLFTARVKEVLANTYSTYDELHKAIIDTKQFGKRQNPNLFYYGDEKYNFRKCAPFDLSGKGVMPNFDFAEKGKEKPAIGSFELIVELSSGKVDGGYKSRNKAAANQRGAKYFTKEVSFHGNEWDKAYETYKNDKDVKFAEPSINSQFINKEQGRGAEKNEYLKNWPAPNSGIGEFTWHLDGEHSQLKDALEKVNQKLGDKAKVRIAHIDTGYVDAHPSVPKNLRKDLGVSFFKNEYGSNHGTDKLNSGFPAEQDGHGCATLAILAGNNINATDSYGGYTGYVGAVPFAEVVPISICDTVYNIFNSKNVAEAIDYAVDNGCEVITMSMAGYPTKRVAEAVNRAYENGVIIVTAAGNNFVKGFGKLAPKAILYPARFERVIAATGAAYNSQPYDLEANDWYSSRSEGGEFMQGNWGPESAMKTAIAGFTPNIAWASHIGDRFHRAGGGTSSATPQIAAAAALWVAYNRENIEKSGIDRSWKKVEAARYALFNSAKKAYPAYQQYYGNGTLQAFNALSAFDFSNINRLEKSAKATVGFLGFMEFISGWFRSRSRSEEQEDLSIDISENEGLKEMISLEILQLTYRDPELFSYAEVLNLEDDNTLEFFKNDDTRGAFISKIIASPYASEFLKNVLNNLY